jgi:hypothetical protein
MIIAVSLPVLAETAGYALWRSSEMYSVPLYLLTLLPFPFGFWLARGAPGRRLRLYVSLGLIAGILGFLGTVVVFVALTWSELSGPFSSYFPVSKDLVIMVVGPAIIFTAGALLGDWVEINSSVRNPSDVATRAAKILVGAYPGRIGGRERADRITSLSVLLTALTPFLTLAGTAVTAYFTYRAAIDKTASAPPAAGVQIDAKVARQADSTVANVQPRP